MTSESIILRWQELDGILHLVDIDLGSLVVRPMSQSADGVEDCLACDWFPVTKWLARRCLHFMPGTRGTSESVSGQPHAAETRSHSNELLQWAIQRAGWDASGVAAVAD